MLFDMKGWRWKKKFPDPIDRVGLIPTLPNRRILIVGDDLDKVVPFQIQKAYHAALNDAGHRSLLIKATGRARGRKHHQLAYLAHFIVKWCANGLPDKEILEKANDILPN